jgi:GT2 family glycosyltransferase
MAPASGLVRRKQQVRNNRNDFVTPGAHIVSINIASAETEHPLAAAAAALAVATSPAVPDLSICIVNWNCRDYLKSLLQSIRAEGSNLVVEVIVVDNASTDDSAAMVTGEFPEVILIRNLSHQGVARANNQAAARARGRLLFFLNNDTLVSPGALGKLAHCLEEHPDVCVLGPRLMAPDGKAEPSVRGPLTFRALLHRVSFLSWLRSFRSADRLYRKTDRDLQRSGYVEHVVGPALLLRTEQFVSIGGWDETFEFRMDEVDLALRLAGVGRAYYLGDAVVIHWGGIAARLDEAYSYRCAECSYVHFIRKYYGLRRARIYKLLITADIPLRVVSLALKWMRRRMSGNRKRANRYYGQLVGAGNFLLRGLPRYWQC